MFKNQRGFTLIEMLIVLMIISVLIILIVPNLGKKSEEVYDKGCDALISVVQAQADAYYIEEGTYPAAIADLTGDYITAEQQSCPDGTELTINTEGEVSAE
ncbi:MAG TPA: competence type IV pilus major pilin ComGC [Lentibacillus sp.]|uniref:competence type IV pilus major pilin ComGC n=1 Tax=Lentibacillus sp. TaxID=1925746 RepID=UPI002B4B7351|nr:competence type IV pilus major pilin ComGC [Lentibacillus sp.]HLR62416.1 competence type IV pilus major pilin ComGC [Lentibacillus sp.]